MTNSIMVSLEKESNNEIAKSLLRDHHVFVNERQAQKRKNWKQGNIDEILEALKKSKKEDKISKPRL